MVEVVRTTSVDVTVLKSVPVDVTQCVPVATGVDGSIVVVGTGVNIGVVGEVVAGGGGGGGAEDPPPETAPGPQFP